MKVTTETITPALAKKYLEASTGNRNLRADVIAALATDMEYGRFFDNGQTIRFSDKGRLMDGHHRLRACIMAEKSFVSLVVRGIAEAATATIDIGSSRSLPDHLKFRGDLNCNNAPAIVQSCVNLLTGNKPKMNLAAYDKWVAAFAEGHEFAMTSIVQCRFMRNASVAGAFAFAFRADPERVAEFALAVRDGDVTKGSVGFILRDFLLMDMGDRSRARRNAPTEISRKVLAAIFAHLNGRRLQKLIAGRESHQWFIEQYKGTRAMGLAKEVNEMRRMARAVSEAVNKPKAVVDAKEAA